MVDFSRLNVEGGDLDAVTFDFDGLDGVRLPLIGSYQPKNAALAITALRVLRGRGWDIPDSAIRTGLEQVSWPGRFELLRHAPAFLLDGSHNAHGMRATVQSLRDRFPGQKFVFLLSIMADKDVDEMLALLLPLAERFVTVAAHTPRAMPAETLAEHIRARGGRAEAAADIPAGRRPRGGAGRRRPGLCPRHPLLFRRRPAGVRPADGRINKRKAMAQCRWAIAFLPFRASRVNDKKVNEENSKNKKVKQKEKQGQREAMYPTSCPCWIQQ